MHEQQSSTYSVARNHQSGNRNNESERDDTTSVHEAEKVNEIDSLEMKLRSLLEGVRRTMS